MKDIKIVQRIGITVSFLSIIAIAGWVFDIDILKRPIPAIAATMKLSTAFAFFLSGITLYFISGLFTRQKDMAKVVLPITTLTIFLLMATLLISFFMGIRIGIEDFFVRRPEGGLLPAIPARPSLGTMINFIAIAVAGSIAMLDVKNLRSKLLIIGFVIVALAGIAIAGYIINMPILYFAVPYIETAMALCTAILFAFIGIGLILLGRKSDEN